MRHGSLVTVIFEDGSTFRGQLGNMTTHRGPHRRVGGFGPFSHEVQTGPGKIELEILAPHEVPALQEIPIYLSEPQQRSLPLPADSEDPNWGMF